MIRFSYIQKKIIKTKIFFKKQRKIPKKRKQEIEQKIKPKMK